MHVQLQESAGREEVMHAHVKAVDQQYKELYNLQQHTQARLLAAQAANAAMQSALHAHLHGNPQLVGSEFMQCAHAAPALGAIWTCRTLSSLMAKSDAICDISIA